MTAEVRLTITAAAATVLASAALYPLFTGARWFWVSLGAVLVVAAAGELVRRLSAPAALVPPAAMAMLLCYLAAVFAGSTAFLGFIPGPAALGRLGDIAGQGFSDIRRYAAPVPTLSGIVLVTAAGVGLTAVLVDLLAVRARKAAIAGLPLLAVFSVTSAIQTGAGWAPFVFAAGGFCALLMTDARERVSRWGRRVTPGHEPSSSLPGQPPGASTLAAAGRRIGVTAVGLAVLLPALVPALPGPSGVSGWLSGLGGAGTGSAAIRAPDPLASLKRELTLPADRVVLRYRTNDPTPAYLRMYALSQFNGRTWSMAPLKVPRVRELSGDRLPPPPGLRDVPAARVSTRVAVDREVRGLRFLPLPYPPRDVDIRGTWRYDRRTLMVFSRGDVAAGRGYEVRSWDLNPTRERLASAPPPPASLPDRYLALPDDLPDLVRELALRATQDADSPYEKAVALQEWFTEPGRFTYSLYVRSGGGSASSALARFLRERIGYCEQFASAMAVMARILDIPARVAVGYTAGSQQQDGTWEVTTHDAHAWPELYFHGVGWLRFEPTPAAGGQPTATTPSYAQPETQEPSAGAGGAAADRQQPPAGQGPQPALEPEADRRLSVPNSGGAHAEPAVPPTRTGAIIAALMLAVLATAPTAARRLVRQRRWAAAGGAVSRAHAAWAELRDDARDLGLPWHPGDSPRAAARRLTENLALGGAAREALTRITAAEERARYARTPRDFPSLRSDSRTVRRALAASVTRPRRWMSRTLPLSTLQWPGRAGVWLAEGLNWLDGVAARLRTTLRRRRRATT